MNNNVNNINNTNYTNTEHDLKLISEINSKRAELENHLKRIEKNIYDSETKYLESTQECGNIVKGWEQQLTAKTKLGAVGMPKKTKLSFNERVFSQSSYSNSYTGIKDENYVPTARPFNTPSNSSHHKHRKIISSLSLKKRKLTNGEIINGRALMNSNVNIREPGEGHIINYN